MYAHCVVSLAHTLAGQGHTILQVTPDGQTTPFATIDPTKPIITNNCGNKGVGLTMALAILSKGYVIVGSTPIAVGSTVAGPGCLIVLDFNVSCVQHFQHMSDIQPSMHEQSLVQCLACTYSPCFHAKACIITPCLHGHRADPCTCVCLPLLVSDCCVFACPFFTCRAMFSTPTWPMRRPPATP